MASIRPEELTVVIQAELQRYSDEVTESVKEAVREAADQCVKDIKAKAPVDTGKYRRGWKSKVAYESATDLRMEVYNSSKPQIAHLLEHGWAKRKGGRVEGRAHIYPAEQAAAKTLVTKAKVVVRVR